MQEYQDLSKYAEHNYNTFDDNPNNKNNSHQTTPKKLTNKVIIILFKHKKTSKIKVYFLSKLIKFYYLTQKNKYYLNDNKEIFIYKK